MRMRTRIRRLWFGSVGLVVAATPAAAGQDLEVGVGIARTQNPVATMSDALCPAAKTWAVEGRGGLRFSSVVALEGVVGYRFENAEECVNGLVPPIPSMGPFQRTVTGFPAAGYPFVSTDARLAFEPSSPSGPLWLRAFGGYGRIWSKDLAYWLAGAGLVFGGDLEAVLDFEWNWFDEPVDEIIEDYLDGELIGTETSRGETGRTIFRIKAGFRWRP